VNASIGQGFVLSSPLQLALMTARLATGRQITPRLVKSIDGVEQPAPSAPSLGLNENHLREVRRAMYEVTNNRRGTAYGSRIIEDAFRMAGKTGTSQVRNITAAERASGVRRNEDLPWERRDHALFVNYAPYEAPQASRLRWWSSMAAAARRRRRPWRATSRCRRFMARIPPLSAYPSKDRNRIRASQEELRRIPPVGWRRRE
jgi:penicillin-binding protein 2